MANLLPPENLQSVRRFHRAHFVLVGSLTGIVCGSIALLALLPLYAIVRAEHGALEVNTPILRGASDAEERAGIMRAQFLVREFRPLASSTPPALEILGIALDARPPGVTVSSMSYVRGDPGMIVLGGVARSRDEINAYRTVLAKDPHFKSVAVPIGILTGSEGGRFTITLSGAF